MRINKLFFQLLIVLLHTPAYVFAAWTTTNIGTGAPTNAAINIDVDNNFHLLFGGSGYSAYGDFTATGESIMYQNNATTDNYTGALYSSSPKYMTVDSTFNSNAYTNGDARKANSSSAILNLPEYVQGKHIVWAGLFWQGQVHKKIGNGLTTAAVDNDINGWNSVTLKTPDGVMHQLTAPIGTKNTSSKTYQYTYKDNSTYRHFYSAFVDVTSLVKNTYSSTNNTFTVGNIKVTSGSDDGSCMYFSHLGGANGSWDCSPRMGHFGGWSLVVVYALDVTTALANPSEKLKNVSIYDGFDQFLTWGNDGTTFETNINLTGFWTPKSGTIKSKLLFFGGGADQGILYEKLQIQQKKTATFTNLINSINPINNQFNSTFSNLGSQLVTSKPYHHGMDMDIYDVSDMMDTSQSSTNVKFGVTKYSGQCDQVFPQILAFSTQLYEPQLCYDYSYKQDNHFLKSENSGAIGILPLLNGTINDTPLEVGIFLRNKEADISVKGVSFYTDLNATLFNYVPNTTATTNVNGTGYTTQPDSSGSCSYDSTSTYSVACNDGHNVRIGLGNGASGYGQTTAGSIGGQEFVYGKFELIPNINGLKDVNESLGLKLNYYVQPDSSAAPIVYNYTLGKEVNLCPPSSGYNPVWGTFNVVDHYASSVGGLPSNNLRTQVSRKPFEVDVATYEKNTDGKYTKKPTIDMSTTVLVEVIDNDAFHDVNASCANPGSVITSPIYVGIANTSKDMTIDIPKQDITYHNFAVKNAAYRLWYFANQDQSLINWNAYTSDSTRRNLTSISGLYQSGYHTVCSSACASPTSTTCFNCIKINYAKPLCSRDNFAVRPESYDLRIYDINQSLSQASALKDSTKIDLSNQYHYTPEYTSATGRINVAAGYNYRYDINATGNDTNLAKVPGYTRYFNGASNEYNATMIWEPEGGHVTSGCNDLSGKNLSFYVANGQMLNTEQNQAQVGEYRLNIIDPAWTAVDWDSSLLTHHTTTNGFEFIKNDCIEGSDSTSTDEDGKIGCTTTSAHSGGGYTYKDHLLRLKPAKFDLNGIAYGIGKTPLAITSGGVGFVYDSDLNITNDKVMAVHSYGPLKAVGYGGETLSNFVTQCYATDLDVSISHNADTSLGFSGRMTVAETGGTQIFDSLKYKITHSPTSSIIDDSYFHKVNNGETVPTISLNFDRDSTTPKEAQAVHYEDLNVSCITKSDCAISAMSNTYPNVVKGDKTMDFTVTHVYGRIAANNVRIELNKDFNTTASYEVYKTPTLLGTDLSPDQFDKNWYVNVLHTDANYGDSAVTVVDPSNGSSLPIMSNSTNGREIYQFPDFTVKQGYKAHIDTEGWLWYGGLNALTYADPNGPAQAGTDNLNCLTHPCFNISIMRIVGNTGSAKSESETNKANKKTTSTGWSTTSEYAPAVR